MHGQHKQGKGKERKYCTIDFEWKNYCHLVLYPSEEENGKSLRINQWATKSSLCQPLVPLPPKNMKKKCAEMPNGTQNGCLGCQQ
jgi:hypothetical protein